MDLGEIIRTVDGITTIGVLIYFGLKVEKRVIAMEQKLFAVIDFFLQGQFDRSV